LPVACLRAVDLLIMPFLTVSNMVIVGTVFNG
jgi:hypothetical protein